MEKRSILAPFLLALRELGQAWLSELRRRSIGFQADISPVSLHTNHLACVAEDVLSGTGYDEEHIHLVPTQALMSNI